MIIINLNYIFVPLLLFFFYEIELKILSSIYIFLDILLGLTALYLNKKHRKLTDIFWIKMWMLSHKPYFLYKS